MEYCNSGRNIVDQGRYTATLYALTGSPTSCQALLQSFRVKRRGSRDIHMHHDWKDVYVVRGRKGPPLLLSTLYFSQLKLLHHDYSGLFSIWRIVSLD